MKHIKNLAASPNYDIHFANHEVLQDDLAKKSRLQALHKASALGNEEHYEVRIVYLNDHEEEDSLETIIMMTGKDYIEIVGGIDIPIQCILRVE